MVKKQKSLFLADDRQGATLQHHLLTKQNSSWHAGNSPENVRMSGNLKTCTAATVVSKPAKPAELRTAVLK